MLGNQFAFLDLPSALAQTPQRIDLALPDLEVDRGHKEQGIIVLLVENDLLNDPTSYSTESGSQQLKDHIFAYAQNAQDRLSHTRAIVMGIEPDDDPFKIATVLEKLYFEGVDSNVLDGDLPQFIREDDNQLVGVVLIGDVPLPVVTEEEEPAHPSLYPYTDFYRKRYIYNHLTEQFEPNKNAIGPNPDIWHGVIVPPSKDDEERRQQLAEYFDKNNQYSHDQGGYADFDQRLLYYNFPEVSRKLNEQDYRNYQRSIRYSEEIAFNRFNRHVLKSMVEEIAEETEPETAPAERTRMIDDVSISGMSDDTAKFMIQKFVNETNEPKNLPKFAESLRTFLSNLNPLVESSGRWTTSEFDSLASLITQRDVYMQQTLLAKTIQLEELINDAINTVQEPIDVVKDVEIRIHACENSSCETRYAIENEEGEGHIINLPSFIHGNQIGLTVFSAEDCNMRRGQVRPPGVSILENNSVRVEANRVNNPDTVIIAGEDDPPPEETLDYRSHAGCAGNNGISAEYEDGDGNIVNIGPFLCNPEEAVAQVRDMGGSKEIDFELYNPATVVDEPETDFIVPHERCQLEDMSFLQFPLAEPGFLGIGGVPDILDEVVYDTSLIPFTGDAAFSKVIGDIHNEMVDDGDIEFDPFNPFVPLPKPNLNRILRVLLAEGDNATYTYTAPGDTGEFVRFEVRASTKPVNSVVRHREPTDETLSQIKPFMTPNIPADGIRFVEFYKDDERHIYRYPNLFRIEGFNIEDVSQNIDAMIAEKDAELNQLLGNASNIIRTFFDQHFNPVEGTYDLAEPMVWRTMGIDQKHAAVLEKYLNRDSFLPTPPTATVLPAQKPSGYEVMHFVADGSTSNFEFAINLPLQPAHEHEGSQDLIDQAREAIEEELAAEGEATSDGPSPAGGLLAANLFACTEDNTGVEIWEWPAGVACWLEEEIFALPEAFSLEGMCGDESFYENLLGDEEVVFDPLAVFDTVEDPSLTVEDLDSNPALLPVAIDRSTLVPGERMTVRVQILNADNQLIIGYLDDPLQFEVGDSQMLNFDPVQEQVFTGQTQANLIVQPTLGQTTINARLGSLASDSIPIRIVENIHVQLAAQRLTGFVRPQYAINARLVDPNGQPITDVNTRIRISPVSPGDGRVVENGFVNIQDGVGSTVFHPNPASTEIDLIATHPVYSSDMLHITVPPGTPTQIQIDSPASVPVGRTTQMPVRVLDVNGLTATSFTGIVDVRVEDGTSAYAQVIDTTVDISQGEGILELKTANETANVNVIAEHPELVPSLAQLPIVVELDTERWDEMYTQNLFASLIGFPAANFFQEDYFGGVHLFNGKTQAAFGFMSLNPPPPTAIINPDFRIETTDHLQQINVQPLAGALSLEVFDQRTSRSQLSTQVPLNFDSVTIDDGSELPENSIAYVPTNTAFEVQKSGDELVIHHPNDGPIMRITPTSLQPLQLQYQWFYEPEPEGEWMELILAEPNGEIGRAKIRFAPRSLSPSDFNHHSAFEFRVGFAGNSTGDPTSLILFDPTDKPDEPLEFPSTYGFEGDNKYILRFGGGSPIGEAVRYNLHTDAVLLGDPTIRLQNNSVSNLHYDDTIGEHIFQDSELADVVSITNFEFNNDGIQDVAFVLKDGRIRLLQGGFTNPPYLDRGNMAFNADGALSIIPFDFKNDGYDDLLVATVAGRLGVMDNNREIITRTDHKINVGKQLYEIHKHDMDGDGFDDLITMDSRGDIRIFYNRTPDLIAEGRAPPFTAQEQIPEDGLLLGNYGVSLNISRAPADRLKRRRDLQIRFPGMPQPDGTIAGQADDPPAEPEPERVAASSQDGNLEYDFGVDIPAAPDLTDLANFADADTSDAIDEDDARDYVDGLNEAAENGEQTTIPLLPWKEGDETEVYFAPITDFENIPTELNAGIFLNSAKIGVNAERPDDPTLDLQENILYTIDVTASRRLNDFVLADKVPDSLELDEASITCDGVGCEDFRTEQKGIYLFISNLQLLADEPIRITYQAKVKHTPRSALLVKKIEFPEKLEISTEPGQQAPSANDIIFLESPFSGAQTIQFSEDSPDHEERIEIPEDVVIDEDSVICIGVGCENMVVSVQENELVISNLQLQANLPVIIRYEGVTRHEYRAGFVQSDESGRTIIQFTPLYDDTLDVMISPQGNRSGQLAVHHSTAPRSYSLAATLGQTNEALDEHDACQAALDALPPPAEGGGDDLNLLEMIELAFSLEEDEDFMADVIEHCPGVGDVQNAIENPEPDSIPPGACAADPDLCAGQSMEDTAASVGDMACFGGGCFPSPFNTSFLTPPAAFPVVSYPGTLVTPYGPYPLPTFFNSILAPLGATTVPGTYNSLIRLYASPSLTGGVGIAACWGPYLGNSSVPPPLVPIPYPPPIGNCMTIAAPMSEAPHCKLIEEGINQAMQFGNSVVSDVNSGISAINSGQVPAQFDTTDDPQGAGGLQIGVGVNLGGTNTFEPPVQNYSNIHIPSFDSIGGAVGSWLDRQFVELVNKLTKLPTIRIILPDIGQLWSDDWDTFVKLLTAFTNNALGNTKQSVEVVTNPVAAAGGQSILQSNQAIQQEVLNFNTEAIEQVYEIANAMPFFELNEHHIDFKIPWLSYGQINDFNRDLGNTLTYYQGLLNQYQDTAETYDCPDEGGSTAAEVSDCVANRVLSTFVVELDTLVQSIQANIEVLNSYKNFPRNFILLKRELADYIRQLACYMDAYSNMLGGWLATIQQQVVGYVEVGITMVEVAKSIGSLMDVFTSFEDSCDICTNERNGNFGWYTLLGLVLPEIPIIQFPSWPDLTLDMTDFNAQVALEVPLVHFVPEPIVLPNIPKVELPDVPSSQDLDLLLQIPPLPVLPQLPDLPELPDLPPIPLVDLPTLPPPPKLPDIGQTFEVISELMQALLNIWCLIKKGFAPVPEAYLRDHVTLLTNRPAYQTPLDFAQPSTPNVPAGDLLFDELRIDTTVFLGVRIKETLQVVQDAADLWNGYGSNWARLFEQAGNLAQAGIVDHIQQVSDDIDEIIPDDFEDIPQSVETVTGVDVTEEAPDVLEPSDENAFEPQAYEPTAQNLLAGIPGNLQSDLFETADQLKAAIEHINANPVDYRIVKEQLGIPDFKLPVKTDAIDKIHAMRNKLIAYSDQLELEAHEARDVTDLLALVNLEADPNLPFALASDSHTASDEPLFTSSVTPTPSTTSELGEKVSETTAYFNDELIPKIEAKFKANGQPAEQTEVVECIGTCLVDPVTERTVQFIPHFDNPASSKTTFVPVIPGRSHVIYSDGPNLYLKHDKDLAPNITVNLAPNVPNVIFDLDHFLSIGNIVMPPKEAVNMMGAKLTENGAASFDWLEVTHPDVYGYGIEMERTVIGHQNSEAENGLADLTIVLLPLDDGKQPNVWVGDERVTYGTLVTSYDDADEAQQHFAIQPQRTMTGADQVRFETISDITITLNENRAVYFAQYSGPSFRMNIDNGYYHIRMTWFDEFGRVANYNENELLAPQIYIDAAPPVQVPFEGELVPIFTEGRVDASDVFVDLAGAFQYQWTSEFLETQTGETLIIPPQEEPFTFDVTLRASQSFNDESFDVYEQTFPVTIYVPEISVEEPPVREGANVIGTMEPLEDDDDLSNIPFSLFRKRWGTWKNLGQLKQAAGNPTTPPLSTQGDYADSYFSVNSAGDYQITNIFAGPAPVIVRDGIQGDVARVYPETGQIEIIDFEYHLEAVPASEGLPTRIAIVKNNFDTVLANVYYIADGNTDVVIIDDELTQNNVEDIGVTIGDRNLSDVIVAANIPGNAESYPGGAAIFNKVTQQNIALINSDGAVRMMYPGYFFRIKNEGVDEPIMFEIADAFGNAVFDIYIRANFDNLEIRPGEIWNELAPTLGFVEDAVKPMFASLLAQNKPSLPRSTAQSPFPDLEPTHPFFKAILDLYERRIVSGFGDGFFRPDAKITRAEFIKIALGATNCFDCTNPTDAQRSKYSANRPFPDVVLPAWFYFCISIAKELGMITGYGDGLFRPNQNISRAEAAAVLIRQSGLELTEAPEEAFIDVPDDAWYVDYVYTGVEIGLIKDNLGFVFPDEQITRGEMSFMASVLLDLQDCRLVDSDEDGMPDWWEVENNLDPLFADGHLDNDNDVFTNLQEYKNGTDPNDPNVIDERCPCIDNLNQNDSDVDGTIDACDTDLDNDGVENALCLFDDAGLLDPAKAAESADNCIFVSNTDQLDTDGDGIGDVCRELDQCPEVPEDFDGINDLDGCPEVDDETFLASERIDQNLPGVYVNKGPLCFFIDYEADLVEGDTIMTAITDTDTHETIFEASNEVEY